MKKLAVFVLAVIFALSIPVCAYASKNDENVKAESVVLMCLDTGDVLYEKNKDKKAYPASVTKVMSILLTVEALDSGKIKINDKVTASKNAMKMGGSQIWLEVDEKMTVEELLKAVIIASANDACTALGEYIAGSSSGFVDMMNERASQLGLKNTNFENCTGLDDSVKNHYSSAYDLAVISREVMKHKIITKYSTVWLDSLRGGKTELNNTNKLVNTYNGITGLKTGTTSKAGFCVSATAKRDGLSLVAVVLGAKTSDDRFDTASYLLDKGFAEYKLVEPKTDSRKISSVNIKLGTKKSITPVLQTDVKAVLVKKGAKNIEYKYSIDEEAAAPIKKGDILGNIAVTCDGKEISRINLVSPDSVEKITFDFIFKNILLNI